MDRDYLLESAKRLQQVSENSAKEFGIKREHLVDAMNQKMELRPDLHQMIGSPNVQMMRDNHANHARFLESIFNNHAPEILVDTVLWVFRAYRSRNFASTYWAAQINAWIEIYKAELSAECYSEIYPYYNWMQINIPTFNHLAEENFDAPFSVH